MDRQTNGFIHNQSSNNSIFSKKAKPAEPGQLEFWNATVPHRSC